MSDPIAQPSLHAQASLIISVENMEMWRNISMVKENKTIFNIFISIIIIQVKSFQNKLFTKSFVIWRLAKTFKQEGNDGPGSLTYVLATT